MCDRCKKSDETFRLFNGRLCLSCVRKIIKANSNDEVKDRTIEFKNNINNLLFENNKPIRILELELCYTNRKNVLLFISLNVGSKIAYGVFMYNDLEDMANTLTNLLLDDYYIETQL